MAGFFLLLDDPFTDMDSTRRAAAIQAMDLQNLAGAKNLQMAE